MKTFSTAAEVFEDAKLGYDAGVCDLVMAAAFGTRADEGRAKDELLVKSRALSEAARFAAKNDLRAGVSKGDTLMTLADI